MGEEFLDGMSWSPRNAAFLDAALSPVFAARWRASRRNAGRADLARSLDWRRGIWPRSGGPTKENAMILALPLAILGAAFLSYVRFATR